MPATDITPEPTSPGCDNTPLPRRNEGILYVAVALTAISFALVQLFLPLPTPLLQTIFVPFGLAAIPAYFILSSRPTLPAARLADALTFPITLMSSLTAGFSLDWATRNLNSRDCLSAGPHCDDVILPLIEQLPELTALSAGILVASWLHRRTKRFVSLLTLTAFTAGLLAKSIFFLDTLLPWSFYDRHAWFFGPHFTYEPLTALAFTTLGATWVVIAERGSLHPRGLAVFLGSLMAALTLVEVAISLPSLLTALASFLAVTAYGIASSKLRYVIAGGFGALPFLEQSVWFITSSEPLTFSSLPIAAGLVYLAWWASRPSSTSPPS